MNAKELRASAQLVVEYDDISRVIELAEHVLATGDGKWIVAKMFDIWDEVPKSRSDKTRGQFRSLCRGLGIELKEGGK